MNTVRLSITDEFAQILDSLKRDFPLLNYPELIRMAVSGYQRNREEARLRKKQREWSQNLPFLDLSDQDQASLSDSIPEEGSTILTRSELWKEVKCK